MLNTKQDSRRLAVRKHVLLADACWIALALLHAEKPKENAFSAKDVIARLEREHLVSFPKSSIAAHLSQHCVANVPPSSGRYRLLWREKDGKLRLFRPGDFSHHARRGKERPEREALPAKYHRLLDWYQKVYLRQSSPAIDPVLAMSGVGKEIWNGIDADQYVAELRAGWPEQD